MSDTMILADIIATNIEKFDPAMTFIDGVGVGGPVVDRLIQMGYGSRIMEVGGSQKPHKPHVIIHTTEHNMHYLQLSF
jgi:hypothetical protein